MAQEITTTPVVHAIGPLENCPHCTGSDFLVNEQTGGIVVFVCVRCRAGWRYELGYVWRVNDPVLSLVDAGGRRRREATTVPIDGG